jgi:hypothetical protein
MNITVPIPDALAARLGTVDAVTRRVLEAFALEEYRACRLTNLELRELLGMETRYEMDGFLKAHGVYEDTTLEDIQEQVRVMQRLGF